MRLCRKMAIVSLNFRTYLGFERGFMARPKKIDTKELLLSKEELAKHTGLTKGFISKAMSHYQLPYYKISARCVRFRMSEVNIWLDQRRKAS
jgi:predicted DNA-binding transcriptional regulator AlpA